MLRLKEYQQRSLDVLEDYFRLCSQIQDTNPDPQPSAADLAFYQTTARHRGQPLPYRPVAELPGLPYVCLRVPTGGGKTLMACHAVGTTLHDLMETDHAVVLWLAPSNAILEQTLAALKDHSHPYRQAVEAEVESVRVLDVEEALRVNRPTLDTATTLIISTMQAFRVHETEGRRVYENNGSLQGHFDALPDEALADLERFDDGMPKYSLANVLRLRRPAVIVDEAHNARTELSFETLARFNPSCIIELTATPDREEHPSNILCSVSAAELKAEEMIKLPIELTTQDAWKELLARAIEQRDHLEEEAKKERRATGEYLRPVMLIKAEANRGSEPITVDVVEDFLRNDFHIPEEQTAVATGASDDLSGVDVLSKDCPIRYVITVQKLQEGWDCPFAYVLCSVAAMRSGRAVEQIVGRVLRMPRAQRKTRDALNRAYAFAADADFGSALNAVRDVLVESGFERQEAETLVEGAGRQHPAPLFSDRPAPKVTVEFPISEPPDLSGLPQETARKVNVDAKSGTVTYRGTMSEAEREALKDCFRIAESRDVLDQAFRQIRQKTSGKLPAPAEEGKPFNVPQLAIRHDGHYEPFEKTHVLDVPWALSEYDATLPGYDGPRRDAARGAVDVSAGGELQTRFLDRLHRQMALLSDERGWTVAALVRWLDRTIPHPDVTPQVSGVFLTRLVQDHLIDEAGWSLDELVRDKYRLRRRIETRIDEHRQAARRSAHQLLLDAACEPPVTVRPDVCFSFPEAYPYNALYDGSHTFTKHYYAHVGTMNGEEADCALFLERLPEVECWVRNLERRPNHAFWLQTATDRFYPDFVCKLKDGRCLVVEYKGRDRWGNPEEQEKLNLGQLWEERSDGQCLFIMPKGPDFDSIRAKLR